MVITSMNVITIVNGDDYCECDKYCEWWYNYCE